MTFDPRKQLKLIDDLHQLKDRVFPPFAPASPEHMRLIELTLMVEANDLQQNRNVLLDRIADKMQILTESIDAGVTMLEQINDRMPLR